MCLMGTTPLVNSAFEGPHSLNSAKTNLIGIQPFIKSSLITEYYLTRKLTCFLDAMRRVLQSGAYFKTGNHRLN